MKMSRLKPNLANIKIQRAGPEMLVYFYEHWPAADLER
jgi:hypothetical protein